MVTGFILRVFSFPVVSSRFLFFTVPNCGEVIVTETIERMERIRMYSSMDSIRSFAEAGVGERSEPFLHKRVPS